MRRLLAVGWLLLAVSLHGQERSIVGAWRLEPELSTPVPKPPAEGERQHGRGPGGGGGGGYGGGGHRGGRSGGGMGMPGSGGPNDKDVHRMRVIMDRLTQPPASLTIVRDASKVIVTDNDGRSVTYTTDGRKEDRLTGDGEFVSRSHFEGDTLVIEEDFGGGVKLTTHAAPVLSGDHEQLEVTLQAAGLPKHQGPPGGGRPPQGESGQHRGPLDSAIRIYEKIVK
ncbi:MAG TPA: hypothetical protein VL263_20260 [Vicinamibacterales bacterium]|nr:hypothetical protein [Vicinamibacterales bacterium]